MTLPDKHIRKAIYDAINGTVVSGNTINVYDYRVTGATLPNHYILLSTQTNVKDHFTKCSEEWQSTILLDVVTRFFGTGNTGSRLLADDIVNAIISSLDSLQLAGASGLSIYKRKITSITDLSTITENENIFRKLIRLELNIN